MSLNKFTDSQTGVDLELKIGCEELKCNSLILDNAKINETAYIGHDGGYNVVFNGDPGYVKVADNSTVGYGDGGIYETFSDVIAVSANGVYNIKGFVELRAPSSSSIATVRLSTTGGDLLLVRASTPLIGTSTRQSYIIDEVVPLSTGPQSFGIEMEVNVAQTVLIDRWKLSITRLSGL